MAVPPAVIESPFAARLESLRRVTWSLDVKLPTPPQSVLEFCQRARIPRIPCAELAALVDCEPALTAELLRNVNSGVRGLRSKITSVTQAIALLGIPASTTILLTSALACAVDQVESPLLPSNDFRRESVERALFARETAQRVGLNVSQAYTAGMLQDILLPILTQRYHVEYHDALYGGIELPLHEFERDCFGWTHAELAARLLLDWSFPQELVEAVLAHHDSPEQMFVQFDSPPLAFAGAAASLLPDRLSQSRDGVTRLVDLQGMYPPFQLMEIAGEVDVAARELPAQCRHSLPMTQRLQMGMMEQIEHRRQKSVVPGRQFGNYVIEAALKESSMGAIFRARHVRLKRPAALKILRADRISASSIQQFEKEVQLTSQLRHPNTVSIFDYGHTPDDLFYYAMELIDGLTLAELVKVCGPLPDGRVLHLLQQACGSLAEAHELQIIHRDIKPENLMISRRPGLSDYVTVLDFGLVLDLGAENGGHSDALRGVVGTPLFMSPEAAQARETIDARSDLYSLAAVGYFLLTGVPVFTGTSVAEVLRQHLQSTPAPPRERIEQPIARELEQLLMCCLGKSPDDRPASAVEMAAQLAAIRPCRAWSNADALAWWEDYARQGAPTTLNGGPGGDTCSDTLITTDVGRVISDEMPTIS